MAFSQSVKPFGFYTERENRPTKGNTWSAIPVALLCMIVNWSEGKQGIGPKGDEVLYNTGGLLSVIPFHHSVILSAP